MCPVVALAEEQGQENELHAIQQMPTEMPLSQPDGILPSSTVKDVRTDLGSTFIHESLEVRLNLSDPVFSFL